MGRCGVDEDAMVLDCRSSEKPMPEVDLGVKMRKDDG